MLLIVGILLIIGLIAAVTKTKWFPYPSSWLKALGLTVPTWIGAVAAFNLLSWLFIFLYILAVVNRSPIPDIFLYIRSSDINSIIDLVFSFNSSVLPIAASPVARSA